MRRSFYGAFLLSLKYENRKKEIFNIKELDVNEFERELDISIFEVELEFLRRLKIETGLGMEELFDKYSDIFDFLPMGLV